MPPSWRSVRHALAPAGEDLVRIGLVADVPDHAVVRRVEDVVQRDRQLDRAEVATTGGRRSATRSAARSRAVRRPAACSSRARQPAQVGRARRSSSSSVIGLHGSVASVVALDDAIGEQAQPARRRPGRCGASAACAWSRSSSAWRAGRVEAEHRHVGRLVVVRVLAGGLAERRRGLRHVEDVVDHLERQAERVAIRAIR